MKRRMISKMEMYLQVRDMIQKHSSSWDGMTAFESANTNFNEKLVALQELSYEQENVTLGVSSLKDEKREEAILTAMEVLAAMRALASSVGSSELKEQMHITSSVLQKASKLEFIHLLDRILEKANAHSNELSAFNIDQVKLDSLQMLRDQVEIAIRSPRNAIIDRKTITLSIDERFEELDVLLKEQLDMMIQIFKKPFPLFYMDYTGARVIHEPKVSKKGKSLNPDETDGEILL